MPLQRLTMASDYSERLIDPLRQKSTRNPPRAVLISSNRRIKPATSFPLFFKSPFRLPARNPNPRRPSVVLRESSQRWLAGYGHYHPGLDFKSKTRKFADFSADEKVEIVREIPISLGSQYPPLNIVPNNIYFNDLNFILPARLISQQAGQLTAAPNLEGDNTSSTFQHPATGNLEDHSTSSSFQHSAALLASTQLPHGSESNEPAIIWRQAVVSSCVVGVALVAVATGYVCATVFRGALNVGHFVYTNRDNIQQTCTACTKAVQSTYNAAKRRMVSIPVPRLPVGMRRRYALAPTPHGGSWQRRSFWQSRNSEQPLAQPLQAVNPVASILTPGGMPGVEYCGLSNLGGFPDRQNSVDPDAFVYPGSSGDAASGAPYMTGELFHEPTPPPPSPSPAQDGSTSENLRETATSDEIELAEQPCISYEESIFSEDIEDEYEVEEGDDTKVPTSELFEDEEHMELEQDFWSLPGRFEDHDPSQASSSLTNPKAVLTGESPVFETAPLSIEAAAPVTEHASPSAILESESPVTRLGSPIPSPPGAFSPPPRPGRPTLSPPPKAVARQGAKSRKRKTASGVKIAKSQEIPPPPPSGKRKAYSPPVGVRRSKRIAKSEKKLERDL